VGGPPPPPVLLPMPVEPVHPRRVFSLTISPFHLASPILELTGEARAADKLGLALVGGVGRYSETQAGVKVSAGVYELGAQARYYLVGDFRHGMQLGAEALYLRLADARLSATGEGLAIGPFAGYKYTTDVGFTVDVQLGFEYLAVRAHDDVSSTKDSTYIPLLNLNVGWSF
jgi:hypothetical protein